MSELSLALYALIECGENLIRTANAIRNVFSGVPDQPAVGEVPAEKAESVKDEPRQYSFTDVREAFSAKSHAGFTEQVKALITGYGADKLSAVKEEDYAALMADLEAIG